MIMSLHVVYQITLILTFHPMNNLIHISRLVNNSQMLNMLIEYLYFVNLFYFIKLFWFGSLILVTGN